MSAEKLESKYNTDESIIFLEKNSGLGSLWGPNCNQTRHVTLRASFNEFAVIWSPLICLCISWIRCVKEKDFEDEIRHVLGTSSTVRAHALHAIHVCILDHTHHFPSSPALLLPDTTDVEETVEAVGTAASQTPQTRAASVTNAPSPSMPLPNMPPGKKLALEVNITIVVNKLFNVN